MTLGIRDAVVEEIRRKGRGSVFTSADFPSDVAVREVEEELGRLVKRGRIRGITEGVYHFPSKIRSLNIDVPPEPMEVARAAARYGGFRIARSGASAANRLGLTTQVPAKVVFLTDGPDRILYLGRTEVSLTHVDAKRIRIRGSLERDIVQAIIHMGSSLNCDETVRRIRTFYPKKKRSRLLDVAGRFEGWVGEILRLVAAPDSVEGTKNG